MTPGPSLGAEELLRRVLSLVSGHLFVVGSEGVFCRDSIEGAARGEGADGPPVAGRSIFEVYGRMPEARAGLERLLSGIADEVALRVERDRRPYDLRAKAVRDEHGKVLGAVGVAMLATERAALERALHVAESRLNQLVDSNMIGMLFWERGGAITGANDALLQLLGYSRDELTSGKLDWRAATPPEYRQLDDAALREMDERGVCSPFEKEYLRKDGRRVPVLIGAASFGPEPRGGVAFVVDESARKAQEQRRRAAEAQLRHAVNNGPFVLWSVDKLGTFTVSEGRGLAALGLKPGQVVGMSAFEFYKDAPEIIEGLRHGLSGSDFTQTVELGGRTFETRTFHLSDVEGRPDGMVGLSLDITDRQQAEAERMKLQAKLLEVQKLESLGLMAGGIAHDFNNILTVIMGNASTALLSIPEASEVREDIEAVMAAARRAADLTRQMLAYSGRGRFEVRPLDLSAQVREITTLLGTTVSSKVQLRLALDEVPAVLADAAQIQQVIMNLVLNGAEAIGEGTGSVQITTGEQVVDEAEAKVLFADEGLTSERYVFLEVSDTGSGMDPTTLGKIFDPFFTTKFTGRGLGLAAVLGIVRAHKGAIKVDSIPGKGSTFKVLLPSCEGTVDLENLVARRYSGEGLVLLVDDDPGVLQIARKMLRACGFSVIEAPDGRQGVRAFDQHAGEITLVLLDMTMPEMDGEETFRAIRQRSSVPVILMSGYSEIEATRRFASRGLAGFLQKPFSSEQLWEKLSQVLDGETAPR